MYLKLIYFVNILLFGLLLSFPFLTSSQTVPSASFLDLISEPKYPGPNETVTLYLSYRLSNIDAATIKWYVNDALIEEGVGLRSFTFTTGPIGKRSVIRVVLQTEEKQSVSQSFTFVPADIDLLWEAETTVPPFYKGKALASSGSAVHISAIPHFKDANGRSIPPSELFYEWKVGNGVLSLKSGKGKNSLGLSADVAAGKVSVTVTNQAKTIKVSKSLALVLQKPTVRLYEEDPLLGTRYEKNLSGTHTFSANELTLRAEIFNYPLATARNIFYAWKLNGKSATPQASDTSLLTLLRDPSRPETSGASNVEVEARGDEFNKIIKETLLVNY